MASEELAAILFTDAVGSTELLARIGDAAAEALRREHDALLAAAVEDCGGRVVKSTGDGLMAVFSSPSSAVRAAIAMQDATARWSRRKNVERAIRIGVAVGEAHPDGADLHGTPVVEAARLCDLAGAGQVLATATTATLARSAGTDFVPIGDRVLKGFSEPVAVMAVEWEPQSDVETLPSPLRRTAPVVGRERELRELRRTWDRVAGGECQVVVVSGEPGVGKTTLVAALAADVAAEATVLFGRCDEDLGVAYQPFVEAMTVMADGNVSVAFDAAAGLGFLVGHDRLGVERPAWDPDTARHRMFDAVVSTLVRTGADAPVLLVVDDLHWATQPTLLLLRHLASADAKLPLLVVATYRDTDLDRAHPLTKLLPELRRRPNVHRVALRGLDRDGVFALISTAAGDKVDERAEGLAGAIWDETQGNPLFVGEILSDLIESGVLFQDASGRWTAAPEFSIDQLVLPEGVRAAITARLSRLSDDANRVLAVAAVVGTEFGADILEVIPEAGPTERVLDALDEAAAAGFLVDRGGGYGFSHALVRQCLYDELRGPRRARLHRRVAEALEGRPATQATLIACAHHRLEAGPEGGIENAYTAVADAAAVLLTAPAKEQAAELLERALSLDPDDDTPAHAAARSRLYRLLAVAWEDRKDYGVVRGYVLAAAREARLARSPLLFAEAVTPISIGAVATPDRELDGLCQEALADLAPEEHALRATLLARQAIGAVWTEGRRDEGRAMVDEALVEARASGDETVIVDSLLAQATVLSGSPHVEEAVRALTEAIEIEEQGRRAGAVLSALYRMREARRLTLGDVEGSVQDSARTSEERGRAGLPDFVSDRAKMALLRGDWAATAALAAADDIHDPDRTIRQIGLTGWPAVEQGDIAPLLDAREDILALQDGAPYLRAVIAYGAAQAGQLDLARSLVSGVVSPQGLRLPDDIMLGGAIAALAEVAVRLGDVGLVPELRRALAPYRGQLVHLGEIIYLGAATRFIGILDALEGDVASAVANLADAEAMERAVGADALVARTLGWRAKVLAAAGDGPAAAAFAREALEIAARLGMGIVADEARALLA